MESLFDRVIEELQERMEIQKVGDSAAAVRYNEVMVGVERMGADEVYLRWWLEVEDEFTTPYRRARVGELLAAETGKLRFTPATEQRSTWYLHPKTGAVMLDHVFRGEPKQIFLALRWVDSYVSEFAAVVVSQLYCDVGPG